MLLSLCMGQEPHASIAVAQRIHHRCNRFLTRVRKARFQVRCEVCFGNAPSWKAQYHVRKAPADPNTVGQILERRTPIFQGKQSKIHYEILSGVCSQNNLNLSKLISASTWNKTPCLKDKCVNSRTGVR